MKPASIVEIKKELERVPQKELMALCLRLAKYKKENKELLTFLLFEESNISEYVTAIKTEIDDMMSEITSSNLYFIKKSLRKILRIANKYIKYTGSDEIAADILIYYCKAIKIAGYKIHRSTALTNLYNGQIKKVNTLIQSLHEDLRYDYLKQAEELPL